MKLKKKINTFMDYYEKKNRKFILTLNKYIRTICLDI